MYVTDESGKTVDDYTHVDEMDDEDAPEAYTVATVEPPLRPTGPVEYGEFPKEIVRRYGVARSAAQQDHDRCVMKINSEVRKLFTDGYQKEIDALREKVNSAVREIAHDDPNAHRRKQMINQEEAVALRVINHKYQAAESAVAELFGKYRHARPETPELSVPVWAGGRADGVADARADAPATPWSLYLARGTRPGAVRRKGRGSAPARRCPPVR